MDNASSHADLSRSSVPNGLHVIDSHQPPCVITSQKFAKGSRFGPLLAKKSYVPIDRLRFPLVIFGNTSIADDLDIPELSELFKVRNVYLDTRAAHECNWMVHVTPAAFRNEQNLIAYQEDNHIYFMSIEDIEVGDVLKVWYAPNYAAKMYVPLLEDSHHQIANNILQHISATNGGGQHQHQQQHQLQQPLGSGYAARQPPDPNVHNAAIALPPIQSIINKSSYQKTDYNPAAETTSNPAAHQHHISQHHHPHAYNMPSSGVDHRLAAAPPTHQPVDSTDHHHQHNHHLQHHQQQRNHHPNTIPSAIASISSSMPGEGGGALNDDDEASNDGHANAASTNGTAAPAKKKKVYQCEMCDKKYATMTNIYKHMRSHQLYLCSLCMRTFPQEHQIKEHKCPQGSVKTPQCHVCFKYLSNSWSLTRHMKIHAHELDDNGGVFRSSATATSTTAAAPPTTTMATELAIGVRVHEVDISEATSCSLATSCSSDLNQTSSDVLMMGGGEHNSQDFLGGGILGAAGAGAAAGLMDDEELELMTTGAAGEAADDVGVLGTTGGGEEGVVECTVCAKTFKNEMRMLKHQRQVHSAYHPDYYDYHRARIKPTKPVATSPGNGTSVTAHGSTAPPAKPKRVPPTPMFPQNLAPPVTPDVAKALATKLNERSSNHINAYLQHNPPHLLHPQHLQTHLQSPPSTPTAIQHQSPLHQQQQQQQPPHHQQQSPLPHHLHHQPPQQSPSRPMHLQPPPHQQLHHQLLQQQQQHIQLQQQQHQQQQQQQHNHPPHHQQPPQHNQHPQLHPSHPHHPHQQQQQHQHHPQPPPQHHHHHQQPPPHHHSFNGFASNGAVAPSAFQRQPPIPPLNTTNHRVAPPAPSSSSSTPSTNGLHDEYGRMHLQLQPQHQMPQQLLGVVGDQQQHHRLVSINGYINEALGVGSTETLRQQESSNMAGLGRPATHDDEEEGKPPVEPYTCDICHKVFQKKNQLTKHRPIHDNTQFVCPFCPNAKSVKSKSTMQKHLRSVHEDRADQWKAPGFVNGLVTIGDRPLKGGAKAKAAAAQQPKQQQHPQYADADDNGDFDSDTNNNVNRGHDDPHKKRKASTSGAKKRTKKDQFDMCDEIDSSSPMILPGDDISAPMFNQHRHLPNNAATNSNYMIYDGDNARSALVQPSSSSAAGHNGHLSSAHPETSSFNGTQPHQNKPLDRFHQTLESLEIVESTGMLNGQLTMAANNGASTVLINGGANGTQHGQHDPQQEQHLQQHHGLISWGDRLTAAQSNPTANVTPMATNASGVSGATAVTSGSADEDGGYEHFYEDYMVL